MTMLTTCLRPSRRVESRRSTHTTERHYSDTHTHIRRCHVMVSCLIPERDDLVYLCICVYVCVLAKDSSV